MVRNLLLGLRSASCECLDFDLLHVSRCEGVLGVEMKTLPEVNECEWLCASQEEPPLHRCAVR